MVTRERARSESVLRPSRAAPSATSTPTTIAGPETASMALCAIAWVTVLGVLLIAHLEHLGRSGGDPPTMGTAGRRWADRPGRKRSASRSTTGVA